jgi:acyl-CoA synthetase (AMP-forming)/AMP-acid ligase II
MKARSGGHSVVHVRDILARNARIFPDKTVLAMGEERITNRELYARVRRRAALLRRLDLRRGDRVAVLTRNSPLHVELFFAVTFIGCAFVPLNTLLTGREHRTILRDADARALLYEEDFRDTVDGIRGVLPAIARFIAVGPRDGAAPADAEGAAEISPDDVPLSEDDIVLQVYTSGTLGRPKGAMLSHRNLIAASASAALELGLSRNDVCLSCAPLPFVAGTDRLLRFLYVGGAIVIQQEFDPGAALAAVGRHGITHALFTPTMMARILDVPNADRYDISPLRLVLYGGSSIPVDLLKRAAGFFGCRMAQSYGQVESSGILTFLHPEDHRPDETGAFSTRKLMSVGQEAIGVEVRVVDEEGRGISPHQVGEVVARGPNIFEGYYKDPAFTAETVRNGWLHTGDMASVDEEGYISIVDRKRDVLMTGGISVYPREIENVIAEHPAVKEVAVVGRPEYPVGEVPVAIVVFREGEAADRESILAYCRENMALFKVPRAVEFLPSLPRNSQGKILKVRLKEQVAGGRKPRTG